MGDNWLHAWEASTLSGPSSLFQGFHVLCLHRCSLSLCFVVLAAGGADSTRWGAARPV
jgi:hypothetical protein